MCRLGKKEEAFEIIYIHMIYLCMKNRGREIQIKREKQASR